METPPRRALALVALAVLLVGLAADGGRPGPPGAVAGGCVSGPVPVGFLGDSITAGQFTATPAPALVAADLAAQGTPIVALNQGHGGAKAADWLPGAPSGYYAAATAAFNAAGVRVVHVMLGTNEAAQRESVAAYRQHLVALLDVLVARGYLVVLTAPPASADRATNARLAAEREAIATLVNGTTVLPGDTQAYGYFLAHPERLVGAGLHPDDAGTPVLARDWAAALAPVVAAQRCPAPHARYSFQNSAIV